jgi:hypothetical protein
MGKSRFKHVSVKKLSVRKRAVQNGSVLGCVNDANSSCIRVKEDFDDSLRKLVSFRVCFIIGRDGRIRRICPKFMAKFSDDSSCRAYIREAHKDVIAEAVRLGSVPK